jgi:hypothetical protein
MIPELNNLPKEKNTAFHYMYKDAQNHSRSGKVVFQGTLINAEQKIKNCLESGRFFIAHQVGIPEVFLWNTELDYDTQDQNTFPPNIGREGFAVGNDDHCWHQFQNLQDTDEPPTDKRKLERFIETLKEADRIGWDIFDPYDRKNK